MRERTGVKSPIEQETKTRQTSWSQLLLNFQIVQLPPISRAQALGSDDLNLITDSITYPVGQTHYLNW